MTWSRGTSDLDGLPPRYGEQPSVWPLVFVFAGMAGLGGLAWLISMVT